MTWVLEDRTDVLSPYRYQLFRACPYCGNASLFRKGRHGTGNNFHPQVVQCQDCRLLLVNPIADDDSLRQYYARYGDQHVRTLELPEKLYRDVDKITERLQIPGTPRFLDVGAASGEFVQAFKEKGWDAHGIELSASFVQFARNVRGLTTIKNCDIVAAGYPNDYFDFINFWHVIEHLRNPIEVLNSIFAWLKPGGMLRLGMPNPEPPLGKIQSRFSGKFSLGRDHTFGFPPRTTRRILSGIGFQVLEHKTYAKPKAGYTFKKRMHNALQAVVPSAVANFQRVDARKPIRTI